MAQVTIYTMKFCPYCMRAKRLLKKRGIAFSEIPVRWSDDALWKEMEQRSGMKTVPQIYNGAQLIGGFRELAALDFRDKLAALKSG